MKAHPLHLFRLALAALIVFPTFAFAVPLSTSPYYTDAVNSYVQDQVSQDMSQLNGFLCLMSAMAPNLMVNSGDYIALIDQNSCFNNGGSGGRGNNTGADYMSVQVNSSRASNTAPMLTKIWFDFPNMVVPMYTAASQAPSKTLPYGVFRMDYCVKQPTDANCDRQKGYIDAAKSGLAFYTSQQNSGTTDFNELALQLSASSSANSGSGVVVKNNITSGTITTTATVFAYSPDYFYRDDGTVNNAQCFSRSTKFAEESAWRYGLYDASTGDRFNHLSGFPIEYTDISVTPNITYNGYISYYGISMQVDVPTGSTVNQITYNTNPPTKTPYTLLKSGGKLTKYTTITKKLSDLHKLPIWYYALSTIPVAGGSITSMSPSTYYEIYWNDTAKQFFVSGKYNSTTNNMEPLTTPGSVLNSAMVAADINGWGLSGWSQLVGGQFNIKGSDFALLDTNKSNTQVITQTQDVVYPQDFAAINTAGGLKCIGDCPTAAQITTYNSSGGTPFVSPGWGPFASPANYTYTLNASTGNLIDATNAAVTQTTASVIYSGKLVTGTDMTAILTAKPSCAASPCYSQSDVDLLTNPVYYVWQTSSDSWSQMAFLSNGTNTVTFYPPLPVNFAVPNVTKYGNEAGATVSLQYGEFGNLWGIPNKCIDITNNADCVFAPATSPTLSTNQRWTPKFSIPFDTTIGVVTAGIAQGTIAKGTQFLVKALDKEIRLAKVPMNICLVLGLTQPVTVPKLASSADWSDPTPKIGDKPVLNPVPAPRVIHGVKQY